MTLDPTHVGASGVSAEAMDVVRAHAVRHNETCPNRCDLDAACDCSGMLHERGLAIAIDALVRAAVSAERERWRTEINEASNRIPVTYSKVIGRVVDSICPEHSYEAKKAAIRARADAGGKHGT
jgi:hypothetical protein